MIALVDSGYWIALLDHADQYHSRADPLLPNLLKCDFLVPWPVMYETLSTRTARRSYSVNQFEMLLKRPNATLIDDSPYKATALELAFKSARPNGRAISLVDYVLRMILDDRQRRIKYLFSFNHNDFRDVCAARNIEMT